MHANKTQTNNFFVIDGKTTHLLLLVQPIGLLHLKVLSEPGNVFCQKSQNQKSENVFRQKSPN